MPQTHRKALIVGGSNGIGLAIGRLLVSSGYNLIICDRIEPEEGLLPDGTFVYHFCDLQFFDEELFSSLAADPDITLLMITAGVGRVADFQFHHIAEIEKIMTIDAVSSIKIIRLFYDRIVGTDPFYAGVMGSIAGWLSSPAASVYSAAKAAIVRLVEAVNIELEVSGTSNRVLDISPASFKGSRFYGEQNKLELLTPLAEQILTHLFAHSTRFIPQYEEVLHGVLERYHQDPHEYGLHSYQYKKDSGRLDNNRRVIVGYLSGTFDLFHVGHLNLLRRARQQCDYLIVGVHSSGSWKGKETFIPLEERKAILSSCRYVDKVVDSCTEDSDAWELWHYDRLFVGSDYKGTERFLRYEEFFKDKRVKIIYFPYTQGTSSTQIRKVVLQKSQDLK